MVASHPHRVFEQRRMAWRNPRQCSITLNDHHYSFRLLFLSSLIVVDFDQTHLFFDQQYESILDDPHH